MEEKIRIFASLHKPFMDMLLNDTWLTHFLRRDKSMWAGEEVVSVEDFETVFKFSLQDLTNWWNKNVLDLITWDDSSVGRALD